MAGSRLDYLVRALLHGGSRRGLLRLLAAIPLAGGLVTLRDAQGVQGNTAGVGGGGGRRRRRRRRHNPGEKNNRRNKQRNDKRQCAKSGQATKKGKPCCKNLIENALGLCAAELTCGTGGPCLVFLTSTVQQGNLGGLAGADAICQQRAQAASLPGTYKAWLSDSTQSPATRFVQSPGPYRRVDGVTVANNWADLTDGTLAAPIAVAENGTVFADALLRSWTHTLANGTAGGVVPNDHCENWTSPSDTDFGNEGRVVDINSTWTVFGSGSCNNNFHLYCFQQS
jgi:hypothetical protein